MARCAVVLLAVALLSGCDSREPEQSPEGLRRTGLTGYTLIRDVSAGETLDMAMLEPATISTTTLEDDVLGEILLTSADIAEFLDKPFTKDAKEGDFLEKELFQ